MPLWTGRIRSFSTRPKTASTRRKPSFATVWASEAKAALITPVALITLAALCLGTATATAQPVEITAQGPAGLLAGTLEPATTGTARAVALILAGSGPTDRDGNNPNGLAAATYRLLAQDLARAGITTARVDKRGIGGSTGDPNDVIQSEYVADTAAWVAVLRARTGASCVWLLGHSEGALVASRAASLDGICGLVLLAAPGRNVAELFRAQVASQPLIAPSAGAFDIALGIFEAGDDPDLSTMHPGLHPIFAPVTARYMRDLLATDPGALLAGSTLPIMMIHGNADVQTPPQEAAPLRAARPDAAAHVLSGLTHVLKTAIPRDQAASHEAFVAASLATYADPTAPLHADLVPLITGFILGGTTRTRPVDTK